MRTTVNGMFNDRNDAAEAVSGIKAAGISADDISILTNTRDGKAGRTDRVDTSTESSAGEGALIGGALGGGAGLLAGLGAIAIPGIGPLLGVGWLVTTAVGAVVGASGGGLIGALIDAGVDRNDAQTYVDGIRGGGTLVAVRVDDADVETVQNIMMTHNGMDRQGMTPGGMKTGDARNRTMGTTARTR